MKALFILHEQYGNYKDCPAYNEVYKPFLSSGFITKSKIFLYQRLYKKYFDKLLNRTISSLRNSDVVIYGIGEHTEKMYPLMQNLSIKAFTDSNSTYWGKELFGIRIIPPHEIKQYASKVLISSKAFENEIEKQLLETFDSTIKIYKIYDGKNFELEAHAFVGKKLLKVNASYKPNLIIYTPTWPSQCIDKSFFIDIKKWFKSKIITIFWDFNDTSINPNVLFEMDTLEFADFVIENSSFSRFQRMQNKIGIYQNYTNVDKVFWHPTIFDPNIFKKYDIEKKYDIAIFGTAENDRQYWIDILKARYPDQFYHIGSLMDANKRLSTEEYVLKINQTKIFVNTQTYKWRVQLKGKIREALSCGAFILEEDNPETRAFVEEGYGVVFFQDKHDLYNKIDYFLKHELERIEIANKGYQWFKEHYSPEIWCAKILQKINMI